MKKYFICDMRWGGTLKIQYKEFFKYKETHPQRVSDYRIKQMNIPLLLFGDGEDFFEFFTKRYFGKNEPYVSRGCIFGGSGIYIPNTLVKTASDKQEAYEEYGTGFLYSTFDEIAAHEFLERVTSTKNRLAQVGVYEKELIAQINKLFDSHGIYEKEERERRKRLVEEEQKRKKLEAEQQRIREEEMARKALEEMLK